MNQISLMTLNMVVPLLFKYDIDHDLDGLKDGYDEVMEMAETAGYAAVDVTGWEVEKIGFDFVLETLEKHHLKVSSLIFFEQFASMDEEKFEERIRHTEKAAELAKRLGTAVIMLVTQASENMEDFTEEQIRMQQVRHFRAAVPLIKAKGLHAVVEDFPDIRLGMCRAENVKSVLDQVPGLELVYDSGNMILEKEDPVRFLEQFSGRIGHVHLKDMQTAPEGHPSPDLACDGTPMTAAPTGTGLIDLPSVIRKLVKMGYDGYMTVEFAEDGNGDFPASLSRSRNYIADILKKTYEKTESSVQKEEAQ